MLRNYSLGRLLGNSVYNKVGLQKCNNSSNSSSQVNIEELEKSSSEVEVLDEESCQQEAALELSRNKSRLSSTHYEMLHGRNPYPEPKQWFHGTVGYARKAYGRYGSASGVNAALLWPTKEELADILEYEQVAYPQTIPEMVTQAKIKRQEENQMLQRRQEDIVKKIQKLESWKKELRDKVEKKEAEAYAAKERKERMIEEVRRHFGYKVDPKDERFKEMLEQKEKEQKKQQKEAKRKAKEEKMIAMLLNKKTDVDGDKKAETKKKGQVAPKKTTENK